jgi:predicted ATPase
MVIGTYRPVEVILSEHPLKSVKQELQSHRLCKELAVEFLTEGAIAEYLAVRFAGHRFPAELARMIHERTYGSPLFMVNVVDYLIAQGLIEQSDGRWGLKVAVEQIAVGVPEGAKQVIEKQIDRLSREQQRVLEAASIAGLEFPAVAVAAGLQQDVIEIEDHCEELARRQQFIRKAGAGELPDGTMSARYSFMHALYQNAMYDRVTATRRAQLHLRIGEKGEEVYRERAGEIAVELAMHFEKGREYKRAVKYLGQAAETAARRFAYQEALELSRQGLELIEKLPRASERDQQELMLQIARGVPLIMTYGYGSPEVERCYGRALELCQQLGERLKLFPELWGLTRFYQVRSAATAAQVTEQLIGLAAREQDAAVMIQARYSMGASKLYLGELAEAREHLEQGLALYDPQKHYSQAILYVHDPGVMLRGRLSYALWYLGYPEQAVERCGELVAMAEQMSYPFTLAFALCTTALLGQFRRESRQVKELAERVIDLSVEYGFQYNLGMSEILRGWALAEEGEIEEGAMQIRHGLDRLKGLGAEMFRPHGLCLLADVCGRMGRASDGLAALAEAAGVVRRTGEAYYEAELYRIKGELLLQSGAGDQQAEAVLFEALNIARKQKAKAWELRAAMSLARLYLGQGERRKANQILSDVYEWFTQGFDTADMKEARALLDETLLAVNEGMSAP